MYYQYCNLDERTAPSEHCCVPSIAPLHRFVDTEHRQVRSPRGVEHQVTDLTTIWTALLFYKLCHHRHLAIFGQLPLLCLNMSIPPVCPQDRLPVLTLQS